MRRRSTTRRCLLGVCLIVFGVILWASDRFVHAPEPLESMTWLKALARRPRAGRCAHPGRVALGVDDDRRPRCSGLSREAMARYSFMAAAPDHRRCRRLRPAGRRRSATLFSLDWVLGFVAAAISSVLVMRWMLGYVKRNSFAIFMWYRIAFGLARDRRVLLARLGAHRVRETLYCVRRDSRDRLAA